MSTWKFHEGIDILASGAGGEWVVAARPGKVVRQSPTVARGRLCIEVTLPGGTKEYDDYLHIDRFALPEGAPVSQGQTIARIADVFTRDYGAAGNKSNHLHMTVLNAIPPAPGGYDIKTVLNPFARFAAAADKDPLGNQPVLQDTNGDGKTLLATRDGDGTWTSLGATLNGDVDLIADTQDKMHSSDWGGANPQLVGYFVRPVARAGKGIKTSTADAYILARFDDNWFAAGDPSAKFTTVYADSGVAPTGMPGDPHPITGDLRVKPTELVWPQTRQFIVTNTSGTDGRPANVSGGQYWNTNAKELAAPRPENDAKANYAGDPDAANNGEARFKDGDYVVSIVLGDQIDDKIARDAGTVRVVNFARAAGAGKGAMLPAPGGVPVATDNPNSVPFTPDFVPTPTVASVTATFLQGETVGINGAQYYPNLLMYAYILPHRPSGWQEGDSLTGAAIHTTTVLSDWAGTVALTNSGWVATGPDGTVYDLVIDYNNDGKFSWKLDGLSAFEVGGSGGSVGDYVWADTNADGVQNAGEYGQSGVTVNLLDGSGGVIASTTTDASGHYSFTGLGAGTYEVQFVAPSGYTFSPPNAATDDLDSDADPYTGRTGTFTLSVNEQRTDLDAGLYAGSGGSGGFVGDWVWDDADQDGVQDTGEYGLSGVSVNLLDGSGALLASTTTDIYGYYSFAGLGAGTYEVEFVAPSGYSFSPANATTDDLDSDAGAGGRTGTFTLAAGEQRTNIDAGLYGSGGSGGSGGSIGDWVWYDADQDGVQDAGESGFGGATVNLRDGSGNLLASTTSDPSGYYSFAGLGSGTYQVEFVPPSGYSLTTPATHTVTLAAGQAYAAADAGVYGSGGSGGSGGSIGDWVWYDADADGVQDAGESGFGGATVNLRDGSGNLLASAVTDSYGYYSFGGLGAGTYQVEFVAPSGYTFTTPGTQTVTLAENESRSDIDAGLYGSGGSGGSGGVIGVALWQDPEASPTSDTTAAEAEPDPSAGRTATSTAAPTEDAQVLAAAGESEEEPLELSWSGVYVGDPAWAGLDEDPLLV